MSVGYLNAAFNLQLDDPTAKAVLIALANHTSPDGECWPSVSRLMLYTALSDSAVRRAIKRLKTDGYLSSTPRERANGSTTSNLYWLHIGVNESTPPGAQLGAPSAEPAPEPSLNHHETTNERASNKARDARAEIPDDWKPSDATMAYVAEKYPGANIPHQIERFILSNQSRNEKVANPEAAFKKFMTNYPNLKVQAPAETAPSGEAPPVDRQIAQILTTIRLYERMGGRDQEIADMERSLQYLRSKGTEE